MIGLQELRGPTEFAAQQHGRLAIYFEISCLKTFPDCKIFLAAIALLMLSTDVTERKEISNTSLMRPLLSCSFQSAYLAFVLQD